MDGMSDEVGVGRRPMYGEFYGLVEPPFDLTPNPRFLFLSPRQREVLSSLSYAFASSKGFTLVLGEAGTGKTTLVRAALRQVGARTNRYVLIHNPTLTRAEFYELLVDELGLDPAARESKARFLSLLQADVEARFAKGGLTGLVVDEAQSLPHELLEEIRLLGNIETPTTKLLNIVLCGQPELADRLNDVSLRQLKQRVALRCSLRPFTGEETAAYISGRLRIAGGIPGQTFTRDAVLAIHEMSRGIPRTINVICDNALIGGFAVQRKPVGPEIIAEVCRDFDLDGSAEVSPVVPAPRPAAPPEPESPRSMFSSITTPRRGRFSFFS